MSDHVGQWRRFHDFNPFQEEENKRAAKISAEWRQEVVILRNMALHSSSPEIRAKIMNTRERTARAKKIPVTLPKIWGKECSKE